MSCLEIVGAGVITIIATVAVLEERGEDLSPLERAHREYNAGWIDEQELEHRLGFHLDDRNEKTRERFLNKQRGRGDLEGHRSRIRTGGRIPTRRSQGPHHDPQRR